MDFNKLIPDFSVVAKTDWAKPHIDTKNNAWLIMAGAALLMVVFVFIPWETVTVSRGTMSETGSRLGITTWFGILSLISALGAVYGVFYKNLQFVFCGAVLAAVWSLVGWNTIVDVTKDGATMTAEEIKLATSDLGSTVASVFAKVKITVGHIGAILSLVASLVAAVVSFSQIKKANE